MSCGLRLRCYGWTTPFGASLLVLLLPASMAAAQDRGGTLPPGAHGRTAAEGRRLDSRIAWLESEVRAATRRANLHYGTLVSVANAIGINNATAPRQQIIALFRTKAGEAATLQAEITQLRARIGQLEASAVRNEAQAALTRAEQAYQDGRFEEADRELAALTALRQDQSTVARAALRRAVKARADLASLQLQGNRAADILIEAMRNVRRTANAEEWEYAMDAAEALLDHGNMLGDNQALARAEQILRIEALPRTPRESDAEGWAQTRWMLGSLFAIRANRESGPQSLDRAITEFEAALTVITPENDLESWALIQTAMGGVLAIASGRDLDPARLNRAITNMRAALNRAGDRMPRSDRAGMRHNIGISLQYLAASERNPARLNEALTEFDLAAADIDSANDVETWSIIQSGRCNALERLTRSTEDAAVGHRAIVACRAAHDALNGRNYTYRQGLLRINWGNSVLTIGEMSRNSTMLLDARRLLTEGRAMVTRQADPRAWARGGIMIAHAEYLLYTLTRERSYWDGAHRRLQEASETIDRTDRTQVGYLETVRNLFANAIRAGRGPR